MLLVTYKHFTEETDASICKAERPLFLFSGEIFRTCPDRPWG